ncbi:phospholipase D-like domain-containing protein [Nocardioides perillae]|uniref:Phospholipase D-like domain-containing protein n=1 Tax=Nocardioides perillae TaxID=1119534 RepID=A0A7Y9RUJ4_9ACTN|nr:hypothetical protein [Nocardioides perillae]
MRTPSRVLALVATLLTVLLGSLLSPAPLTTTATAATAPAPGPHFSRPGSLTIERLVLDAIAGTPSGSYIRGVTWSFDRQRIADALIAAHRRGAVVRLLISRKSRAEEEVSDMRAAGIGSDCSPGRSCLKVVDYSARGSDRFDGTLTTLHQKSWTFSMTSGVRRVSVITSANASVGAAENQYNDAYVFVDNDAVYDTLVDVFVDQTADRDLGDPWRVARISRTVSLSFGPWNSPSMADPVLRRIESLPTNGLVVRVGMAAWRDPRGVALARALAAKKRAGAKVFVLAGKPIGAAVLDTLRGAGIPVRNAHYGDSNYLHSKFMTAKWVADGRIRTRVWAGSENWGAEPRGSDELTFQVAAGQTHGAYVRYFDSLFNR